MYYLKCNPKFFYATKKHFPVKKCILLLDLSILQKSKVTNNLITILGYSNDKNIYIYICIAKNIISIGKLILFTRFGTSNQQIPKFKKTKYLKLTLKQVKLQRQMHS